MNLKTLIDIRTKNGESNVTTIKKLCELWEDTPELERKRQYNEALIHYPSNGWTMKMAVKLVDDF